MDEAPSDILAILGSTTFKCQAAMTLIRQIVSDELSTRRPDAVVVGNDAGVCKVADEVAVQFGVTLVRDTAQYRTWRGPGGREERDIRIAHAATRGLRVFCAHSQVSGGMLAIDLIERQRKPVRRVVIDRDGEVSDTGWLQPGEDPSELRLF